MITIASISILQAPFYMGDLKLMNLAQAFVPYRLDRHLTSNILLYLQYALLVIGLLSIFQCLPVYVLELSLLNPALTI